MFYTTLGNKARYDTTGLGPQPGWGLSNTGPFSNFQSDFYWTGTEYAPATDNVWVFNSADGAQNYYGKTNYGYAWAVHTGDVGVAVPSSVPVPAATWLFGSGLLGLIGTARRKA